MPKFYEEVVGPNTKNPYTYFYETGAFQVDMFYKNFRSLSGSNVFREFQKPLMDKFVKEQIKRGFEIKITAVDWTLGWWDKKHGPIVGYPTLDFARQYYNAECQRLYPKEFAEYLESV